MSESKTTPAAIEILLSSYRSILLRQVAELLLFRALACALLIALAIVAGDVSVSVSISFASLVVATLWRASRRALVHRMAAIEDALLGMAGADPADRSVRAYVESEYSRSKYLLQHRLVALEPVVWLVATWYLAVVRALGPRLWGQS